MFNIIHLHICKIIKLHIKKCKDKMVQIKLECNLHYSHCVALGESYYFFSVKINFLDN
jgi:hypothetical protein